ncbi:cytochrome P450 [Chytriomyces cf. hyalinus JEL632]|nr:cytochrome P450 [Chytriomyces cf. hyalinus JEL632]
MSILDGSSSSSALLKTAAVAVLAAVPLLYFTVKAQTENRLLPPGPPGDLIGGNFYQMGDQPQHAFKKWREQYGPVFTLRLGAKRVIVVSDPFLLKDIVTNPAFNDRPQDMFLGNILLGGLPTLTHHTDFKFKAFRKIVQATLIRSALMKYAPNFETETHQFLESMISNGLNKEVDVKPPIHRYSFSMILSILFGHCMNDFNDEFMHEFFANTDQIFLLAGAATDKLAFFPLLGLLPNPNVSKAKQVRQRGSAFITQMMDLTQQKMSSAAAQNDSANINGNENMSVMELIIRNPSMITDVDRPALINMFNNLTVGAVDTVSIAIQWCFAFLAKYPEAQSKIHAELDTVVGRERLPNLDDEPNLHYLNAFLRETQRVRPVSATAVPRIVLTTQTWGGYTIPAGTWLMFDFHGLGRNEVSYGKDVEDFRPERYLSDGQFLKGLDSFNKNASEGLASHPRGFSFGRRVCPGKDLAQMQLFMGIACLCQTMTVSPSAAGIDLDDMQPGLTNPPRNLRVKLSERFAGSFRLI